MPESPRDADPLVDPGFLESLRSGDPEALGRLLDRLWAPLVAYARRILPDDLDPQDVVQEAFVRLWARRAQLREDGSLKALLYTTVRNASLDQLRTSRRRQKLQAAGPQPVRPRTPYEDVHGAELQRLAAGAVARLPEKRQEVFRMVREEGLSYREAATVLGLSEQTVANHMSLALADLRAAIRPYLSDQDEASDGARESRPRTPPVSG
ncbi:MAG: RNA polymerase sigma-70 factor [Longimicrobiales bacterium]